MIEVYFDGACEPYNPGGTASYGWLIKKNGSVIAKEGKIIGSGDGMTNNVAEYCGLLNAMKALGQMTDVNEKISIYGDSVLVCNMVSKKWGFKKGKWLPHKDAPHLRVLLDEIHALLGKYEYEVEWVPREKNQEADSLSKQPLVEAGIIQAQSQKEQCSQCNGLLVERKGKYGSFFGCSNYPRCTFTKKVIVPS